MSANNCVVSPKLCCVCNNNMDNTVKNNLEKCTQWLNDCSVNSDVCSCDTSQDSSYLMSSEATEDGLSYNSEGVAFTDQMLSQMEPPGPSKDLSVILNQSQNIFSNININKSKKVHLGNVTYINGPIYINQDSSKGIANNPDLNNMVSLPLPKFIIEERRKWLAQPSIEDNKPLEKPAKFVIICHSAADEAKTHAENVLLIRLIQQFHIESQNWNDIAYNFLIGSDGNAYEGRGWNIVGSHTRGYNWASVGICFVGCFVSKMPPEISLKKAKALIEYGVQIGAIEENYSLIGHCQTYAGASPGKMLFDEIKTWKNFDGSISIDNPSPLKKTK